MKILLVYPPWFKLLGEEYNEIPLGLCYLAGFLNKNGHNCKILNLDLSKKNKRKSSKYMYNSFQRYLGIINNKDHKVWKEILIYIKDFKPDIVGIHIKTGSYKSGCNIAEVIKQNFPDLKIVAGGPHATIMPEETAKFGTFDFVIRGEGEETFLDLVNNLENNKSVNEIKGLTFFNKKLFNNLPRELIQNVDLLPFPERDAIYHKKEYSPNAFGLLFTARGCPFQCTYCASNKIWGRMVRFRSPENIIKEITLLKNKYKVKYLKIRDDTFTLNKDRAKNICKLMIKERLNLKWHCDTRADCVDKELIKLMRKAGCIHVSIGLESGSNKILKDVSPRLSKLYNN